MYDEEKNAAAAVGYAQHSDSTHPKWAGHVDNDDVELTHEEQRRIIRRIDLRLILTCGLMYCISLIDRTNLSAASIAGMATDLNLIEYRYSILALLFFVTYVIVQPPATLLCRRIGPRPFLSIICFVWGVIMMCHGFVHSWEAMIPLRLLLGALEAGFFPGCLYLISTWYTRYELHRRYSGFYLVGCVANGFGGILAYGLIQMDGLSGYGGWRWIFILEGVITSLIALVGYFALVDFPDRAAKTAWKFLSEKECNWVMRRIEGDRDDAEAEPFDLKRWAVNALDLKIWGFALLFCSVTTTSYAIAFFLPILLRSMDFSVSASQLLVAPPYAFAGLLMLVTSFIGDKYKTKGPLLIVNALITILGLSLMGFGEGVAVRLAGVFLTTGGANANLPTIMAYQANNIRGQWRRAFCSATLVGFGGIGGIAGSLVFRTQDSPHYRPGIYATLTCQVLVILVVSALSIYFRFCNKKADSGRVVLEGLERFRYTI